MKVNKLIFVKKKSGFPVSGLGVFNAEDSFSKKKKKMQMQINSNWNIRFKTE